MIKIADVSPSERYIFKYGMAIIDNFKVGATRLGARK